MTSITDFPYLNKLENRLKRAFQECDDHDMEIGEIIVFGSYGAGVAEKKVSDLDVFIHIEPESLGPNDHPHAVAWCMEEETTEREILEGYGDWFAGLDVISPGKLKQWKGLYRMVTKKNSKVYSLTNREYLGHDELERRKEIDVVRGKLDLMDDRGVEGPRRERLEQKLERLT